MDEDAEEEEDADRRQASTLAELRSPRREDEEELDEKDNDAEDEEDNDADEVEWRRLLLSSWVE